MASPHGCPHACPRTCTPPPMPARQFPAPRAVATRVCVAAATTQSLGCAPQRPPPPCAVRCPCLVSSRAERTTMAFFVVHASTEGRRVLLSSRKTSRTRVTPSAARSPRGGIEATPVVVSHSTGMAPTPLVVDRAAPPCPTDRTPPNLRKCSEKCSECAPPTGLHPLPAKCSECCCLPRTSRNQEVPHRHRWTAGRKILPTVVVCPPFAAALAVPM